MKVIFFMPFSNEFRLALYLKFISLKIIITGTTGMVGEGVLLECMESPHVTDMLSVSLKQTGFQHPKLKEYIIPDFLGLKENEQALQGYDACFFCAGISSIGKKEPEFTRNTYDTI